MSTKKRAQLALQTFAFSAAWSCLGLACNQTPDQPQGRSPKAVTGEQNAGKSPCPHASCSPPENDDTETSNHKTEEIPYPPPSPPTPPSPVHSSPAPAPVKPAPTPSSGAASAQLKSGEALYLANCGTGGICHTAAKNGPGNVIDNRSDQALAIAVNAVPSRGGVVIKMTPEQIKDLGAYLRAP